MISRKERTMVSLYLEETERHATASNWNAHGFQFCALHECVQHMMLDLYI